MIKRLVIFAVMAIVLVALTARAIISIQGLTVTSWYRTPWGNYGVDGKPLSLHLIGWAFDVVPVNQNMQNLLKVWPFKFVVESDHVHLQIF